MATTRSHDEQQATQPMVCARTQTRTDACALPEGPLGTLPATSVMIDLPGLWVARLMKSAVSASFPPAPVPASVAGPSVDSDCSDPS